MSGKNVACYPLVNCYITMENHHFIAGKINYKWQFSIAMLNYQRVMVVMLVFCVFWILLALGDDCDVPCPSRLQPWAMGAMAACNVLTASLMAAMTSQQVAGIAPQRGSA